MSPLSTFRSVASRGLIATTFSHVVLNRGLGSSCSQPLFAKLPSWMVGSGRTTISTSPFRGLAAADDNAGSTDAGAEPASCGVATQPDLRALPQAAPYDDCRQHCRASSW